MEIIIKSVDNTETLNVLGFIKLKNKVSKLIGSPEKVRIVTEQFKFSGLSGACTVVFNENSGVNIGRLYQKSVDKMLSAKIGDEFTDSNRKIWIKVNPIEYDQTLIYNEENK